MVCVEDPQFTRDYHDPAKRSIPNAVTVEFEDGTTLDEVVVDYPIGHKRRRAEAWPLLTAKFATNLARKFASKQMNAILKAGEQRAQLEAMPVHEYVDLYAT
jgi:2-methylcitrate dehydratase